VSRRSRSSRSPAAADPPPATLVLCGVAGIGKTALWETGVDRAQGLGFRVLQARPSGAEMELSFAALADLCDEVDTATLPDVPLPQLRALEVALLRADPEGTRPESFAISAGFTSALRAMSVEQPLVVAIDDLQWLDGPSADVLVFAARRLRRYLRPSTVASTAWRRSPPPSSATAATRR
jgi:AAA ATPase domain